MGVINKFLRIGAAPNLGESTEINPSVDTPVSQQTPFNPPSMPEKVYLTRTPPGFVDTRQKMGDEQPYLETIDKKLANKAIKVKELAEKLRRFKDEDLRDLELKFKEKEKELKASIKYEENLKNLELQVKEVGENLLHLMIQNGQTTTALYKLQNLFVLVSREVSQVQSQVSDLDKLKAIEEILKKDYGDQSAEEIFQRAQIIAEQGQKVIVNMKDRFNIFRNPDIHRKQEGQYRPELDGLLTRFNDSIIGLLIELHNIDIEVQDTIGDLGHYGYSQENNTVQLPQHQPLERAATNEQSSKNTNTKYLASI